MRAFVVDATGAGLRHDVEMPVPEEGEALVRVLRAGICNTDLEILAGYMGFNGVVGHEFVGVVEEVNCPGGKRADNRALAGKRVVGEINLACTRCKVCEAGGSRARNHCPKRTVLGILGKHGTYAEYLTLPCRNLHVVPDNVSDAAAVFAEPLAAACRIIEQGLAPPEAKAAILGDGKLGLLIAEVLARRKTASTSQKTVPTAGVVSSEQMCQDCGEGEGADESKQRGSTTLIGRHKEKMDLCCSEGESSGGAAESTLTRVIDSDLSALVPLVGSFDVVVDATGSPQGLVTALELCRPMGTVVLKSTCATGSSFNPAPVVINEQRVVGSRCGPFEAALELLSSGDIDVERYISGVFPLEDTVAALEAAQAKGALKVQIVCSRPDSK